MGYFRRVANRESAFLLLGDEREADGGRRRRRRHGSVVGRSEEQ
jgi:hypothetical protein